MKKAILIAAASLFVIGQALAQGQTPPPAGAGTAKAPAANSQNTAAPAQGKKAKASTAKSSKHMSSKPSAHRMARSHGGHKRQMAHMGMKQGQPQQQAFGSPQQPQKLICKKGQKPDGITCM
jgi:hypothetical protein